MLAMLLPLSVLAQSAMFLEGDMCVRCHVLSYELDAPDPTLNWRRSVHFRPDSGCADCHGGEKSFYSDLQKGHVGLPEKSQITELCGACHAREMNDVIGRESGEPGQFNCTVTCADCHGYHFTPAAVDTPLDESTCSRCHPFDKVERRRRAVDSARARFARLEAAILEIELDGLPAERLKLDLAKARDDFARSFHNQPPELMAENAAKTISELSRLGASIGLKSPERWRATGVMVVALLSLALVLLIGYNTTSESKEDGMSDKNRKGSWSAKLALLLAAVALVLVIQEKLSPTENAVRSINQTVTNTVTPQLKKVADRATVNSVFEMKRMMVTLDEIKENSENPEIKARIDQLKLDMEELAVKIMVHE